MSDDTLSTNQAAKLAGVSRQTIVDWISKGYLQAKKRTVWLEVYAIRPEDLDDCLQRLKRQKTQKHE